MQRVILLTGFAGAGKSHAARELMRAGLVGLTHGATMVARLSFADPLKAAACAMFGMPRSVAWGNQEAREAWTYSGRNGREWLQWLGTDVGRRLIGPDHWVDMARAEMAKLSPRAILIFDDCRFPNEAQVVPDPFIVEVQRPGGRGVNGHISEHAHLSIKPHAVLMNDGDLEQLRRRVAVLAQTIARRWNGEE